jgi:hypothetical protein
MTAPVTNGDRGSLITAVIEKATAAATAVDEDKAKGKAACAAAVFQILTW